MQALAAVLLAAGLCRAEPPAFDDATFAWASIRLAALRDPAPAPGRAVREPGETEVIGGYLLNGRSMGPHACAGAFASALQRCESRYRRCRLDAASCDCPATPPRLRELESPRLHACTAIALGREPRSAK